MGIHDWTRVVAGVFHDFHHGWITAIRDALNHGLLPEPYYALAEQVAQGPIPDVLTLQRGSPGDLRPRESRAVALAEHPPRVKYVQEAEQQAYVAKANRVAVLHSSGDRVVAYLEIVSPGNKSSEAAVKRFLGKLSQALERGCHVLVIDPFPPTGRDPRGLHARFWEEAFGPGDTPGVKDETPLGLVAYRSDLVPTAYFEPVAVGQNLPDMPLFLTADEYVNVPLETTYRVAWEGEPRRWKEVLEAD